MKGGGVHTTQRRVAYISWFINDSPLLWHSAQYPVWASLMDVVCDASVPNQPQKPFLFLSLFLTQQPSIACPFPRPSDGLPFSSNKSAQVSLAVMIHPTSNGCTVALQRRLLWWFSPLLLLCINNKVKVESILLLAIVKRRPEEEEQDSLCSQQRERVTNHGEGSKCRPICSLDISFIRRRRRRLVSFVNCFAHIHTKKKNVESNGMPICCCCCSCCCVLARAQRSVTKK